MASTAMKTYRIPTDPVGMAYYRQGQRYEPGQKVLLPADELPPGWRMVNGKPKPVERHAWKLLEPGKRERSDEAVTALAAAKAQAEELQKQLAEQQRMVEELEATSGDDAGKPRRGIVEDGDDGPSAPPKDPDAEDLDEVDDEEEADEGAEEGAEAAGGEPAADVTKPARGAKKGKRGAKAKAAAPAGGRSKDEEL